MTVQLNPGFAPDPAQVVARDFILSRRGGALAWLAPGIGKSFVGTECAIAWINQGYRRVLIACPGGLVEDWRIKLARYASITGLNWDDVTGERGDGVFIISHALLQEFPANPRPSPKASLFVTLCILYAREQNPACLEMLRRVRPFRAPVKRRNRISELIAWKPDVVIVDEHHRFKSYRSKQTKGLDKLTRTVKPRYRLGMTGTAALTVDPEELRPQLLFADQQLLVSKGVAEWNQWRARFCKIEYKRFGETVIEQVTGVKNQKQLDEITGQLAIRMDKVEGVPDRNPINFVYYRMSATAFKYYGLMAGQGAILTKSLEVTANNPGVKMLRCAQIRSGFVTDYKGEDHVFDDSLYTTLWDVIEGLLPTPVMVVYNFRPTGDRIMTMLKERKLRAVQISGETPASARSRIEADYQNGKLDVVVGQWTAIALGLTFTRGRHMVCAEPTASLEAWLQAPKRIERRGQTEPLQLHCLIEPTTMDIANYEANEAKQDFAALVSRGAIQLCRTL